MMEPGEVEIRRQGLRSPAEGQGEHQRSDDRGVGLDDELRGIYRELAPGDLLVGYGARVRAVTGGRVGYLAEVTPHRDALPPQVLVEHGDHADREVTGYAAADLEEADGPF